MSRMLHHLSYAAIHHLNSTKDLIVKAEGFCRLFQELANLKGYKAMAMPMIPSLDNANYRWENIIVDICRGLLEKMARISRLNSLTAPERSEVYHLLIPEEIFKIFEINKATCKNPTGECAVVFACEDGSCEASIEIKRTPRDQDPIFYIEVSDSRDLVQLNWDFIWVNDVRMPRYNTDITPEGVSRWLQWTRRNLDEEFRALSAGLAPGQVRQGLRLMDEVNNCLDRFCEALGLKSISMEALYYHNAITYEQHGFRYFEGEKLMKFINHEFRPGGKLFRLLDDSPFRKKAFYNSVRGRSWAIHDGILEDCGDPEFDHWAPPKMYKMIGKYFQIDTFPTANY